MQKRRSGEEKSAHEFEEMRACDLLVVMVAPCDDQHVATDDERSREQVSALHFLAQDQHAEAATPKDWSKTAVRRSWFIINAVCQKGTVGS
eukprot:1531952-Rhodomonas_salina.2